MHLCQQGLGNGIVFRLFLRDTLFLRFIRERFGFDLFGKIDTGSGYGIFIMCLTLVQMIFRDESGFDQRPVISLDRIVDPGGQRRIRHGIAQIQIAVQVIEIRALQILFAQFRGIVIQLVEQTADHKDMMHRVQDRSGSQ